MPTELAVVAAVPSCPISATVFSEPTVVGAVSVRLALATVPIVPTVDVALPVSVAAVVVTVAAVSVVFQSGQF